MIRFQDVTFSYTTGDVPGQKNLVQASNSQNLSGASPVFQHVNLHLAAGELALVTGPTGVGKSTLLKAVNGLVPHFTGGTMSGQVILGGGRAGESSGFSTRDHPPRALAHLVGYVGQDPFAGFATDRVEDELVYAMEQLGTSPATMRARLEEVLVLLGLVSLRKRDPAALSAGEAQRVAIGAALTPHPQILVLDEPTSALDPAGAEDVMSALARLVDDLDLTVLMAEHKLERVIQFADHIVRVHSDGTVDIGPPRLQLADSPVAPPLIRLARALHLDPLPLTVREARRAVSKLRFSTGDATEGNAIGPQPPTANKITADAATTVKDTTPDAATTALVGGSVFDEAGDVGSVKALLAARSIEVVYPGPVRAVKGVDLNLYGGQITGLMGRNGSGKTSLLWALAEPDPLGDSPRRRRWPRRRNSTETATPRPDLVLVPASPTDLFYANTVAAELPSPSAVALLKQLGPGIGLESHPRDLSEGQRLALALAIQLSTQTQVVLLDEPTRGL
ncbi:MAG: ATP-binding cassette domain-containing protein, partial [Bifidobacteriaceae bacterium]|nr:ATP-binding cassette domain-containing protein [Bifidobacteriaceae bacterium]